MSAGCLPRHVYAGYLLPATAGLALGAALRASSQPGPVWQVICNMARWVREGMADQLLHLICRECCAGFFNLHRCNIVRADKFLSVVFWFMPSWWQGCRGSSVSQSLCYSLKYLDTFWMYWMKFGIENLWLIIQLRCRLNLSHTLWDIVKCAWWIGTKLNADICGSQMIHLVTLTLAYTVCAM